MGLYELANQIAVLLGGRRAAWLSQPPGAPGERLGLDYPATLNHGVALQGALRTTVVVDLREFAGKRQAWAVPDVIDDTSTYRVRIDGTWVPYVPSPGDGLPEILAGLVNAINTDATVKLIVVASEADLDGDSVNDAVLIQGLTFAHYTFNVGTVGGTGTMTGQAEADNADVIVWAQAGGQSVTDKPSDWRMVHDGEFLGVDQRGFVERFDTASLDRLYVQVDGISGTGDGVSITYDVARLVIGPSTLPS